MKQSRLLLFSAILLAACASPTPSAPAPTPTFASPTVVSPTGYRPLQMGDTVEGVPIDYQYFMPSLDKPVLVVGVGREMLQLVIPRMERSDGLIAYIEEIRSLLRQGMTIYGFDENDLKQKEPRPLTFDGSKPVEIAYVPLKETGQSWGVTEGEGGIVFAAYKFVRRRDGGLRFVDGYDARTLNFTGIYTLNLGTGGGLVLSTRLGLLRTILSDPTLQRGGNVFIGKTIPYTLYDARVIQIDPSKEGLAQNVDWAIMTRPGPNPGLSSP